VGAGRRCEQTTAAAHEQHSNATLKQAEQVAAVREPAAAMARVQGGGGAQATWQRASNLWRPPLPCAPAELATTEQPSALCRCDCAHRGRSSRTRRDNNAARAKPPLCSSAAPTPLPHPPVTSAAATVEIGG